MLLAPRNDTLTRARLTSGLWSFGHLHQPPLTETFGFAPDGRVTGYQNRNEVFWSLEDGVLHLYNRDTALTWRFDIMFAAAAGLILRRPRCRRGSASRPTRHDHLHPRRLRHVDDLELLAHQGRNA